MKTPLFILFFILFFSFANAIGLQAQDSVKVYSPTNVRKNIKLLEGESPYLNFFFRSENNEIILYTSTPCASNIKNIKWIDSENRSGYFTTDNAVYKVNYDYTQKKVYIDELQLSKNIEKIIFCDGKLMLIQDVGSQSILIIKANKLLNIPLPTAYKYSKVAMLDEFIVIETANGKGLLNTLGELIISPNYTDLNLFYGHDKLMKIWAKDSNNHINLFKSNGKAMFSSTFEDVLFFPDNNAYIVKKNSKFGIVDSTGKILLNPTMTQIDYQINYKIDDANNVEKTLFENMFFCSQSEGDTAFAAYSFPDMKQLTANLFSRKTLNDTIELFNPVTFDLALVAVKRASFAEKNPNENTFLFNANNKIYLYDRDKNTTLNKSFDSLAFTNLADHYIFTKNGKSGLINRKGKEIIPANFDEIYTLTDIPLIFVGNNLKTEDEKSRLTYSIYDKSGQPITQMVFKPTIFNENNVQRQRYPGGMADYILQVFILENTDGKFGLYNFKGQAIIPSKYDDINVIKTEAELTFCTCKTVYYAVKKGNLYALFNANGLQISEFGFQNIEFLKHCKFTGSKKDGTKIVLRPKND